ncbi:MAG: type IV pilus assembly protein PilM [bacterium]
MPENTAIGLDIDEKSVKFVKLKKTDRDVTLLKYAVREIPLSDDKVKAISILLKDLFKTEKPETEVYVCAFGTNISLKRLTIPVMPDEEIADALKWEAKNIVPFPMKNSAIDFFKIGKVSDKAVEKYDIMFAVAGEELLNFLASISKESAVRFSGISIIPLALCAVLNQSKKIEKDKINAIIDFGAEAASINIFKGDTPNFTREITVAGDSLTKAMTGLLVADQWQLNLTYEQAEEIKKKYGIPKKDTAEVTDSGIPLVHIHEMMAPTLQRLQNEIIRSFDYYKEEFRTEKIDNIFLTGGGSRLKNLEEFLSNALGTKVEMIDPVENIKVDPASGIDAADLKEASSRLALAVGLALEQSEKINFQRTNEAPSKFKGLEKIFKKININFNVKVPVNIAIWSAAAVIALAVIYNFYLIGVREHFKKEIASKQAILTDVKALVEKRAILEQISREETHIRETLSQITRALPAGIVLTNLKYDNSKHQIWLTGEAKTTNIVGKLLKNFEDSPNFKKTLLIEARKAVVESVQKIIFKITFNLT